MKAPVYRVLLTDCTWSGDLSIERETLARAGAELVLADAADERSLVRAARGAAGIMTHWAKVTAAVIDAASECRIVARLGIGLDNIDVEHATRRGILVTNLPDYCLVEVAEHTMALLFALARNVGLFHRQTKSGVYDLPAAPPMRRIEGRTLGLVGLGSTARLVAHKARAAGMNVLAAKRTPAGAPPGVRLVSLDELLEESDFVSLHVPLTPETRHIIDRRRLALLKRRAFLINTARGGLIDHAALAEALAENRIAGAALDVQDPEPPDMNAPPYNDARVIVTPHAAFLSEESLENLRTRAARQVAASLSGATPEHVCNAAGQASFRHEAPE